MRMKRMLIGVAAATAAIGIGTGTAFAFWNVSGSGSGASAASVAQTLTVIPETPSGANATLFPGGPAAAVYFEITNPNPYPVEITNVAWSSPTSTNTSSCASSNISVDASAPTSGLAITVPGNTTSPLTSIAGVLDLSQNATSGCQGVAFDVVMNVTGAQQA
jgi:hypothetical protein